MQPFCLNTECKDFDCTQKTTIFTASWKQQFCFHTKCNGCIICADKIIAFRKQSKVKTILFCVQTKSLHLQTTKLSLSMHSQNRCILCANKIVAFRKQWNLLLSVYKHNRCIQKAVTFVSFYEINLGIFLPFLKSMVVICVFCWNHVIIFVMKAGALTETCYRYR